MAFFPTENRIGLTAIAGIDTGFVPPSSTTGVAIPTTPAALGMIVRAVDPVFGEGEFILLKGVAATVVGSCVVWDGNFATTLTPATVMQARPVAFAMSANVNPLNFGWYQIEGQVTAFKDTAATIGANVAVGISAAGAVGPTAVGLEIEGARSTNTGSLGAGTTSVPLYVARPTLQGRIT